MKTGILRLMAITALVAFSSNLALAEGRSDFGDSGQSFFERLFAPRKDRRRSQQDWWGRANDNVRIFYGSGTRYRNGSWLRRIPHLDDDPEAGSEGYGMGNLTYVPDRIVSLGGLSSSDVRPADPAAAAIYDALNRKDLDIRVLPDIRQATLDQYRARGFQPLWLDNGKPSERARSVLQVLADAAQEGMQPANYLPPGLSDFKALDSLQPGDLPGLAHFELGLTAMALKYAHDASGGQFDPRKLSRYNDITPERVPAAESMGVLAKIDFPAKYLEGLQPQHPAYGAMRSALAEIRKELNDKAFAPIAKGPRVKLGQTDDRIPAIRKHFASVNGQASLASDPADKMLDSDLSEALAEFQKTAGIKPTGRIDDVTVNALNNHFGSARDLSRLVDNMERLRWLPKRLGSRYVFVNQPAFEVRVMDGQTEVWHSKVIVGKPNTQTSAFHDQIETVVFNPSWGVPPSIIAKEYLPKLWNDPSYLDRIGFRVTTPDGREVSSRNVDWWSYSGKVPYNIEQPPGSDNALGELKFLFPNAHNIYMHDTPTKNLFAKDVRAFSHGCVRVENPREFAAILLGWNREKIDANTESGVSQTVALTNKVPVHITYFTAWPDASGRIQYFNDIYGRDETMEKARGATLLAQR